MLSVFQIFKMLIGVIIFIFILMFFLRVSDMYMGIEGRSVDYEVLKGFDKAVRQTYTSGNPGTFLDFDSLDYLVYEPPKLKSVNQKSMTVTTFVIPSKSETNIIRDCDDYSWFRFCWAYAYPKHFNLIFTPLENTEEARNLIKDIIAVMPDYFNDMEFAHCNGDTVEGGENFLAFIDRTDGMRTIDYEPCTVDIPDGFRLVTISSNGGLESGKNEIILNPQTAVTGTFSEHLSGLTELTDGGSVVKTGEYRSVKDIYFLMTTGKNALDFMNQSLRSELGIAAKIMHQRMILVKLKMNELNVQQCAECPTPFPMECGYVDHEGNTQFGLYEEMVDSLFALTTSLEDGSDYEAPLGRTVDAYKELNRAGCE